MTNIDIFILAVIGLCVLMGLWRGLLLEGWGLLLWLLAIFVPILMAERLAVILPIQQVVSPETRFTIGASLLFIGVLFCGSVGRLLLTRIVARSKTSFISRILGAAAGAARGGLIISLGILAATLVPELQFESWWVNSSYIPEFLKASRVIHDLLPDIFGRYFLISR